MNIRLVAAVALAIFAAGAAPVPARADDISLTPRIIPVGKWAEGIVFADNTLWVAESGQQDIAQVDPNSGGVMRRIKVGRLPVGMTLANGAIYALVETDKLVWQQVPSAAQGKTLTGLDGCPTGIAAGQYLWVLSEPDCSSAGSRLMRIDLQNWGRASSQPLNQWDQAVAVSQGKVWVAHARSPVLSVVDEQTLAVRTADLQGASLWSIAACCGEIHAGGRIGNDNNQGIVAAIDPATMQERRRQLINQRIAAIADDAKNVVAIGEKGAIWVFSQNGIEFQRLVALSSGAFEPEAAIIVGDTLYISQQQRQGENGAILVVNGWRPAAAPAAPITPVAPQPQAPAATPAPAPTKPPAAAATPTPSILSTNCPFHVINVPDELGMYQNADAGGPKVGTIPAGARGLTADRCVSGWCHVTFGNSTGWVQSQYLQPDC
jgi:hypothetical protein